MDIFLYSNKGGKEVNEDSAGYEVDQDGSVFVVADGLGGHQYGELSSACVVEFLLNEWKNGDIVSGYQEQWIQDQVSAANQMVLKMQAEYHSVMKTTFVALLLEQDWAIWANSGDSRLYYFHDRRLEAVTEDHSVAYKKYKAGEITRDQICKDEDQSCLLRSLGSRDRYEPDIHRSAGKIEPGDAFLLCTDGAWEYLRDEEILIDLLKAKSAREWTESLLLRIMSRVQGNHDNLTLLTIMIESRGGCVEEKDYDIVRGNTVPSTFRADCVCGNYEWRACRDYIGIQFGG